MFSYLRPTGRRVSSNQSDSGPSRAEIEEEQSHISHSVPDEDVAYRPIVSSSAPVLPPIPRVASIYGAPSNLSSIIENEGRLDRKRQMKGTEERAGPKAETVSRPNTLSVGNEPTIAPSSGRYNFSRPFTSTTTTAERPSSRESRPAPAPSPSRGQYQPPQNTGAISDQQTSQKQSENQTPYLRQPSNKELFTSHNIQTSTGESDAAAKKPIEVQQTPVQGPLQLAVPPAKIMTVPDPGLQGTQPKPSRIDRTYSAIPTFAGAGMPMLPQQNTSQYSLNESESMQMLSQQRQSQFFSQPNNNDPYQRSNRPMLTRLNPMSILARRRSSQNGAEADGGPYRRNLTLDKKLPDDYDPRIRGNKVHDFNAPRSRQAISPLDLKSAGSDNRFSSLTSPGYESDVSLKRRSDISETGKRRETERQHTPVFKEHFGDEIDTWRFDEKDRRNQSTTGILQRAPAEIYENRRSPLPPFAQRFPEQVTDPLLLSDPTFAVAPPSAAPIQNAPSKQPRASLSPPPRRTLSSQSPSTSPSRSQSRTPPGRNSLQSTTEIPHHLQSAGSRFSFDMAGVGSAMQEKLLEDKHRQKNAQKARMSRSSQLSAAATDEDSDFDDDDVDFGDDIEEEIPGMNADEDEYLNSQTVANSTLVRSGNSLVQTVPSTTFSNTPKNQTAGQLYTHANVNLGGGLSVTQPPASDNDSAPNQSSSARGGFSNEFSEDDDLYFDDGMIEDIDLQAGSKFDESVFDDENSRIYGRPLRDLDPEPLSAVPENEGSDESSEQSTRPISLESSLATGQNHAATADTSRTSVQPQDKVSAGRRGSTLRQDITLQNLDPGTSLTHDNLAAYHDALALATYKAVQDGRFERKISIDESDVLDPLTGATNHVTFDQLPVRNPNTIGLGVSGNVGLDDYEADDDEIVAEANAEALENDDEGYYGREFGFYPHSNGSTDAELSNGGYFGPAGMNDIKRSHSGRVNGQEPSLTPITERSEFSQRNSMISLGVHGGHGNFPPTAQTPGLAQIADSIQFEDDSNMSIAALMKLRQSAWGGSSTSLHSNGGNARNGSPPKTDQSMPPPARPPPPAPQPHPQQENKSRPTPLKLHTQDLMMTPILPPPQSGGSDSVTSPLRRNAIKGGHSSPAKGHSRNSSGADSVTYIREKDEDGTRWVMERRRTGESGQIEVLGREVVEGGTI
ncbi:hypothetical protein MMC10_008651 [Thelotrema lepadinum]|nr:hypothetical protein [Thelotrema lepadinum]